MKHASCRHQHEDEDHFPDMQKHLLDMVQDLLNQRQWQGCMLISIALALYLAGVLRFFYQFCYP